MGALFLAEVCQESAVMWMESVIAQKYTYKGGIHVRKLEEEDFVDVIGLDGGEDGVSAAKALRVEDVNGQPRRSGRRKHHRDDHHYIDIDSSISIREFQMRYVRHRIPRKFVDLIDFDFELLDLQRF